ncbi:holo-ACP synthase [Haloplasma contractile]|uniref:Holo-[acyl-carrier-protein] synthase n=1 Tax=Haloplasma contractile SSD-17B TaxID=1033810 RepID=U2FIA4_9MOLU|nr:holo-ACP synthase [Haloplasma contractile]ERJ10954.1 Holo-acyl-carrier-protein synthase [Haloplasma contractile SSD-17B]ERJ12962.1 Holo-acyl-carrier-protein synthase [Haloplasma contractile SSD-17B]
MIAGIGTDIVEIHRIRDVKHLDRFKKRILTSAEIEKYDAFNSKDRKLHYLAGRFAAKEAFSKAIGTGIGNLNFTDIEILNDEKGKPYINHNFKEFIAHISISHSKQNAIAYVILENI